MDMPSRRHPADLFFVLRPMLFFPGWSTMLAGYFILWKNNFYFPELWPATQTWMTLALLFVTFGAAMGASFLLNQLRDIDSDKENGKLFFLSEGILSVRLLYVETVVLLLISLAGFYINLSVGLMLMLFILITGYLYNFAPFRMKDHLWGSIVANILMGGLAFAIGWLARYPYDTRLFTDALPYLIFNTVLYLYTTLPDRAGDARVDKKTPAVVWGRDKVIRRSLFLYGLGMVFAWGLHDFTALLIYLLTLPLLLPLIKEPLVSHTLKATKFGIFFFALLICFKWPWYLILMIALFGITKYYFRKRFNFDYPNFKGQ
ncbi:MAG: hypothetical protein D6677_10410 [Calditrichaeota bacterium]|nr:MAG: hypothetical protein D6677_10410 [Calditrichota bacterium]